MIREAIIPGAHTSRIRQSYAVRLLRRSSERIMTRLRVVTTVAVVFGLLGQPPQEASLERRIRLVDFFL